MIDLSRLWITEWIVIGFFGYLIVLAIAHRIDRSSRLRVIRVGLVCIAFATMLSQLRLSPVLQIVREWVPGIYLVEGYWLCGAFFRRPMRRFEGWLMGIDTRLLSLTRTNRFLARGPRVVLEYFELTYLLVYPFVPAAFGLFCWLGHRGEADRFWATALIAGYGAYGVLPWIQTRPPRALEPTSPLDARGLRFRRYNLATLGRLSVQVNTFPSGHASMAVAAALTIASVDLGFGLALLVVAASITLATVLGRYHYTIDSVLGVLLGIAAWWVGLRV